MKFKVCLSLLLLFNPAFARVRWHRVAIVAGCAASAADGYTTARAAGAYEANPFLRGRDGAPAMGRISLIKAASCVGLTRALWNRPRAAFAVGIGSSVTFGSIAAKNARIK